MEDNKIETVDDFIRCIKEKNKELSNRTSFQFFAYRGEQKYYPDSGKPNLFRGEFYNKFVESPTYEKNIIDEVLMNRLSERDNYLHAAMDAQHGGFPSRLLDISFNSLIALFFATTPHFHQSIDLYDKDDGVVIIYAIDKMYSSSSSKLQKLFEKIIDSDSKHKIDELHGYIHKFIDHSTINNRIRAQHGGFVLFSGHQYVPIPEWKQEKVIISGEHKSEIRNELKNLFGLTIGSIYPESDNLVGYLLEKAELLVENNDDINDATMYELEKQFKYFLSSIIKIRFTDPDNKKRIVEKLMEIEIYLISYSYILQESDADKENVYVKIQYFLEEVQKKLPAGISVINIGQLQKIVGYKP